MCVCTYWWQNKVKTLECCTMTTCLKKQITGYFISVFAELVILCCKHSRNITYWILVVNIVYFSLTFMNNAHKYYLKSRSLQVGQTSFSFSALTGFTLNM